MNLWLCPFKKTTEKDKYGHYTVVDHDEMEKDDIYNRVVRKGTS
jgi:hypothetical protein